MTFEELQGPVKKRLSRIDQSLWEQALEIHRTSIVMNAGVMSTQRLILPGRDIGKRWQGQEQPDLDSAHLDLPRIREGGVNVVWFAACAPAPSESEAVFSPLRRLGHIDVIYNDILGRYPCDFKLARTVNDVRRIRASGKIAVLIGMQAADILGGSIRALRTFHRLGVQYITLTHAWSNDLIDSSTGEERWGGLGELGRQIIGEMNRLGVIPDVTHASDNGARQVLDMGEGPVIASHSNCRSLCGYLGERNMSDDLIQQLAAS